MDMDRGMENDRERAMERDMDRAMGGEMTMDMQRERAIYVRCDGRIWHAMRRMQYQQTVPADHPCPPHHTHCYRYGGGVHVATQTLAIHGTGMQHGMHTAPRMLLEMSVLVNYPPPSFHYDGPLILKIQRYQLYPCRPAVVLHAMLCRTPSAWYIRPGVKNCPGDKRRAVIGQGLLAGLFGQFGQNRIGSGPAVMVQAAQ